MNKLDSLSKILIATGQINYLAAAIYTLNLEMIDNSNLNEYHLGGIYSREQLLNETVDKLTSVMEEMANQLNIAGVCNIDQRVAKVPFEILVHKMDDTETDYEEDEINN